jgi:ribosomal protein S18 acetylase RimI-like enzyme
MIVWCVPHLVRGCNYKPREGILMSEHVSVREMQEGDLSEVVKIQAYCYTEVAPESPASLLSKLRASPTTCFVAVINRLVVGYLISLPWEFSNPPTLNIEIGELPTNPDCLYLHDLAVAASARKLGAGRALVDRFLMMFQRFEVDRAALIAVQDSAPYWKRYGFRSAIRDLALNEKLLSYGPNVEYMELVK